MGSSPMYEGGRKESDRLEKLPISEYEQVTCWFRVGLLNLKHWKFDEEDMSHTCPMDISQGN